MNHIDESALKELLEIIDAIDTVNSEELVEELHQQAEVIRISAGLPHVI